MCMQTILISAAFDELIVSIYLFPCHKGVHDMAIAW